jgi:outer membrane protein OmpA-like peptidoglycan-associated protein
MGLQIRPSRGTIYTQKDARSGGSGESSSTRGLVEMRNCILLTVVVLLALAAFAQEAKNISSSNSASTAVSEGATSREPLASPRPKDFWDGDDPNLVNLITHPFANKKYVQRQVTPIRDRINELEQITSENSRMIKDVDTRAQQGIQLASEKTSLADQHSSDAANKAQLAQTAANQASTRVSSAEQMVGNLDQYKGSAQTEIRFRPGQTVLSKTAKDALDEMAGPLKDQRGYIIEVRGFAPGQGQAAIRNSQKMADSVVRYLVLTHSIPVYRIYTMSMGNAAATEEGAHASGARVEVNVLKNDLVTSSQH